MKNLQNFFQNPFEDWNYGLDRVLAFTTDHLERMKANNTDGRWSARVAATAAALAAVNDTFIEDEMKLGRRKSRKKAMRTFRAALRRQVAQLHLTVMAKFGVGAPEVKECFPRGRLGLARCPDDQLSPQLEALVKALTARAAALGPEPAATAQGILTEWEEVYQASEAASGAKTAAELERRQARAALHTELFLNLLALAQSFPAQPEKLALFMQQSLLTRRQSGSGDTAFVRTIRM